LGIGNWELVDKGLPIKKIINHFGEQGEQREQREQREKKSDSRIRCRN